ncbi:hypothetical protein [Rhizobium sp.]|uniref:hypothetical protein n=1 Tax=Rhizobium sp. TaxID=391 RepID=UPI002564292A|nr:hypothetical protein [Rhizobium sp. CNPSo 4062]
MMESIALAKAIEIRNLAREEQWRRNEDLFYLDNAGDPSPFFEWLGRRFAAVRSRYQAMKKADRPEMGRSACDSNTSCGQAACSRM